MSEAETTEAEAGDDGATAVYLRVSTKAQSLKGQESELKAWCKREGVDWGANVYRDKFTGTTMDRPGFAALLDAVRAGRYRRVVVWRLDRLGRTLLGLVDLFAELQRRKVDLVSVRDGLDLSTTTGRMISGVLATIAVYETEVRNERQHAGIAAAKAAGKRWGGAVNLGRRIKVKPEQEAVIVDMRRRGESVAAMCRATGLARATVYSVLRAHGVGPETRAEPDPVFHRYTVRVGNRRPLLAVPAVDQDQAGRIARAQYPHVEPGRLSVERASAAELAELVKQTGLICLTEARAAEILAGAAAAGPVE